MYKPPYRTIRRFYLNRKVDETGTSGTGIVATGVQFPDGTVALRWEGSHPSTVIWNSIQDVRLIHGHKGNTDVVFID